MYLKKTTTMETAERKQSAAVAIAVSRFSILSIISKFLKRD